MPFAPTTGTLLLLLGSLSALVSSCGSAVHSLPPSLGPPLAVIEMPRELRELSALTLLDEDRVAALHDEAGWLYVIKLSDGTISSRTRFHGAGDFEGLELTDTALYALQSDGDLFRIDLEAEDAKKFETPLTAKFDTEGLAFDPETRQLLIACKEFPGEGLQGYRAVYAFDVETESLKRTPVLLLDTQSDARLRSFKPSALALHPRTGWWLMLSSTTPMLVALDSTNQVRGVWGLPADLLPQPEALAVLPDGHILIGSEGRPARIARFALPTSTD